MDIATVRDEVATDQSWPVQIYKTLKALGVSQISYVPDAGHSRLIELSHGDDAIRTTFSPPKRKALRFPPTPGSAATARCC